MEDHTPVVGEIVAFYVSTDQFVLATVTAAHFWDWVDLELPGGMILRRVRRVFDWPDFPDDVIVIGRFQRLVPLVPRK